MKVFDDRAFLVDLQTALRASADLTDVEDTQILIMERQPLESDLPLLSPPAVLIMPQPWEPTHYGPACGRVEPFPVAFLCVAQTLDASDDADRYMDATSGAAAIRRKLATALQKLGTVSDGCFAVTTASGVTIDYLDDPQYLAAEVLRPEEGNDIAVAPLLQPYQVEF